MTVLTRHLMGGGSPEVNISDSEYTYYKIALWKTGIWQDKPIRSVLKIGRSKFTT